MVGLTEGLGFEEVNQEVTNTEIISGTNVYGTVSVNTANGELQSNAIGSPVSVYGASIQAGSGNVGAGSEIFQVFPTAFTAIPAVLAIGNQITADTTVTIGSVSIGSFYAASETASDAFSWLAIGI